MTTKVTAPQSKWQEYFAMTATSLAALSLAPSEASAAVVKVLDRPVAMPTSGGTVDWDVDGNGAADFRLLRRFTYFGVGSFGAVTSSGYVVKPVPRGRGMVSIPTRGDDVKKLSTNFVVGPTLASNGWVSNGLRTVSYNSQYLSYLDFFQFQAGDNYFGFRFDKEGDGNLHYGFAIANINDPRFDPQFTITKWAYNDVANAPVTIGPLNADPTSVPGPIGLAGLAAGAAWSRRLRKRIRQAS